MSHYDRRYDLRLAIYLRRKMFTLEADECRAHHQGKTNFLQIIDDHAIVPSDSPNLRHPR